MDYTIKITEFEGPMDLLLHLIKESNISIYDISIDEITKQYLDYIDKMEELNINVAGSYLVMAAELMEIKSKSLLPSQKKIVEEDDDTCENTKENLIKRLVEYQKYKSVTPELKKLEEERKSIYTKAPSTIPKSELSAESNYKEDVSLLYIALQKFFDRKKMEKPLHTKITNKEYSVRERKGKIKTLLEEKGSVMFDELFDIYSKSYIIVTFLSVLEMTKEREIYIKQEHNFSPIMLELRESTT